METKMRRLMIMTFTDRGYELGKRIGKRIKEEEVKEIRVERIFPGTLYDRTYYAWNAGFDLLFIGAVGIAVRAIAGLVASKISDRAVIVTDETGKHVIPVLSGHVGGADALSFIIAGYTGGEVVITAASHVRHVMPFDEWASEKRFVILNKERTAITYDSILSGKAVKVLCVEHDGEVPFENCERLDIAVEAWAENEPEGSFDVVIYAGSDTDILRRLKIRYMDKSLIMAKRYLIAGVGCRRGISAVKLMECISDACEKHLLDTGLIDRIATIDIKAAEEGIRSICADRRWRLDTFSAGELRETEGEFDTSEFVEKTVGTDNVCERAAVRAGGKLIVRKTIYQGVTVAVAAKDPERTRA